MRTLILAVVLMLTTVTSLQAAGEYTGAHGTDLAAVLDPSVTGGQSYGKNTEARILAAMDKACGFGRPDFSKGAFGSSSVAIPSITAPSSSLY